VFKTTFISIVTTTTTTTKTTAATNTTTTNECTFLNTEPVTYIPTYLRHLYPPRSPELTLRHHASSPKFSVMDFSQAQAASQLSLYGSSTQARFNTVSRQSALGCYTGRNSLHVSKRL
jgi:hypothetical protein